MSEKLMLIVPKELIAKIDDNRGDLSRAEFINFLIDSLLKEKSREGKSIGNEEIDFIKENIKKKYVTKEEFQAFIQDNKKLLKKFIEFIVEYEIGMNKKSDNNNLSETNSKLKELKEELAAEEGGEVKIRWKQDK